MAPLTEEQQRRVEDWLWIAEKMADESATWKRWRLSRDEARSIGYMTLVRASRYAWIDDDRAVLVIGSIIRGEYTDWAREQRLIHVSKDYWDRGENFRYREEAAAVVKDHRSLCHLPEHHHPRSRSLAPGRGWEWVERALEGLSAECRWLARALVEGRTPKQIWTHLGIDAIEYLALLDEAREKIQEFIDMDAGEVGF